jgi:hypothetical protein
LNARVHSASGGDERHEQLWFRRDVAPPLDHSVSPGDRLLRDDRQVELMLPYFDAPVLLVRPASLFRDRFCRGGAVPGSPRGADAVHQDGGDNGVMPPGAPSKPCPSTATLYRPGRIGCAQALQPASKGVIFWRSCFLGGRAHWWRGRWDDRRHHGFAQRASRAAAPVGVSLLWLRS